MRHLRLDYWKPFFSVKPEDRCAGLPDETGDTLSAEIFLNGRVQLCCGDSLHFLRDQPDGRYDSVVTDPPYALVSISKRYETISPRDIVVTNKDPYRRTGRGFMGKKWDTGETVFAVEFWQQVLRVLKPGGHVVAFGGTRTYHRLARAIEDAGFEIRDQLGWCFGSGFPKSHNAGNGWGTALKPAWEPICLARKPLIGTVAANVLQHGTGAINIDGCRIASDEVITNHARSGDAVVLFGANKAQETHQSAGQALGRWPANIIHDGSDEVVAAFPDLHGAGAARGEPGGGEFKSETGWGGIGSGNKGFRIGDECSAARFFYTAKADADDRLGSKHPTVKPVDLMQWLVRLVTPKNGLCLDPFAGTGTTAEACYREGMRCMLVERETEYQGDIRRRMALVLGGPEERRRESIKAKNFPIDHGPLFAAAAE